LAGRGRRTRRFDRIDKSVAFVEMTALAAKTADRDAPVPLEGETGTGQEADGARSIAGCGRQWLRAVF
jgi:DNA-binding NtrC family response regulator